MDVEPDQLDFPAPAPFTVTLLYHNGTGLATIILAQNEYFRLQDSAQLILWLTH